MFPSIGQLFDGSWNVERFKGLKGIQYDTLLTLDISGFAEPMRPRPNLTRRARGGLILAMRSGSFPMEIV